MTRSRACSQTAGAGQLDDRNDDAASALLDDPNYWTQCWMMTAVRARKPLPDAPFAAASK